MVVHLQVNEVHGAPLALEELLGLGDDGGDEPVQGHLLLEQSPGQREEELRDEKERKELELFCSPCVRAMKVVVSDSFLRRPPLSLT